MSLFSLFCSLLIGQRGLTVEVKSPTVALACASQRAFSYCWCGHKNFENRGGKKCIFKNSCVSVDEI